MDKAPLIAHWVKSSDIDFRAMEHLFEKKDYTWSLFIGHLVIEKLLKAYYIEKIDINPPLVHILLRIAERSKLDLTEEQKDFLVTVTTFNIQARYNDIKMDFYKTCNREFTTLWIKKIKEFRKWIKKKLSES